MCVSPQTGKVHLGYADIPIQFTANKHTAQSPIKDAVGTHNQEVHLTTRDLSKQIAGLI